MIDILRQQIASDMDDEQKLYRLREFLQIAVLKFMYDKNFFDTVAFVGGTALRVLFGLRRFSEDLDFSQISKTGYDFRKINTQIVREFKLNGLDVEAKIKDENAVHSSLLKFSGILKEFKLSPMREQKIGIKIDVDTNPPAGALLADTFVNKTYVFTVSHYTLPSLFASKLHACFYRKFMKGRDFYDFIWYLSKKVKPNLVLLNNAIQQTQGADPKISEQNLKEFLVSNIERIDLNAARKDAERFLEDKAELRLFDAGIIKAGINEIY